MSRKSGFSVVEIIVAVFIVGLVLAIGVMNLKTSVSKEESRGLAYSLAAELRAARSLALQGEKFVAVCIPNDHGANPFSRSFVVRGGYDRGELLRSVNFDDDLSAAVFTGRWTGDTVESESGLPDWLLVSSDEFRLVFRPDGTAFSSEIAKLDGRYHFVVGNRLSASGDTLTSASNFSTLWVSEAGTVGTIENELPVGTLPQSNDTPVAAAPFDLENPDRSLSPRVVSIDFLPEKVDGLDNVGLGQTAVQIHPQQKLPGMGQEGVEYGLTTFRIRATDPDGGPLKFQLSATASRGEPGNFSYEKRDGPLGPSTGGQMSYVQTDDGRWVWESVISWRPPPGAASDTEYEFLLQIEDPEGHMVETSSSAELMPRIALLLPENVVYETNDHQIVMTNLDGTSHRSLTLDDQEETNPFFSSDGTRLYTFYETDTELSLITRNADGTQRQRLRTFEKSFFRRLTFDPFNNYAAYLAGSAIPRTVDFDHLRSRTVTLTVNGGAGGTGSTTGGGAYAPVPGQSRHVALHRGRPVLASRQGGDGGGGDGGGSDGGGGESDTITVTVYSLEADSNEVEVNRLEVMHLNSGRRVTVSEHAKPNFRWYGLPRFGLSYEEINIFDEDDERVDPPPQHPEALRQGVAENLPRYFPDPGYREEVGQVVIRDYPPRAIPQALPALGAGVETEVFNLARPRYYVECRNTTPCLTFHDSTNTLGSRVLVEPRAVSPSWSSDGQWLLYARQEGSRVHICRQRVLNAALDDFELEGEEILYTDTGISSPLLSGSGEYAFFLKGGKILRLEVGSGSRPIDITPDLTSGVRSFVLSP